MNDQSINYLGVGLQVVQFVSLIVAITFFVARIDKRISILESKLRYEIKGIKQFIQSISIPLKRRSDKDFLNEEMEEFTDNHS